MMKKILAQALKEWRLFRRDKLLIVLAVLMPLIFMSLAGLTSSLRLRNVQTSRIRLRQYSAQPDLP